jgi:hypothetical protein
MGKIHSYRNSKTALTSLMQRYACGVALVVLALLTGAARADDWRIAQVAEAWNTGDSLAVQLHLLDDGSRARIGLAAEQGGELKIMDSLEVVPGLYAASIDLNGRPEIWLFAECKAPNEKFWCGWGRREPFIVGGAELGQGLDIATSAAGVGLLGAVEMNPLGLAILPLKGIATAWTRRQDYAECVAWRKNLDSLGFGAGVANIITLTAGIANPLISLALFFIGTYSRNDAATEAAVYECAELQLAKQAQAFQLITPDLSPDR